MKTTETEKEETMSSYREQLLSSAPGVAYANSLWQGLACIGPAFTGTVQSLHLSPIKSLGMCDVDAVLATKYGFMLPNNAFLDRSMMLACKNRNGQWHRFSQRDEPALALVQQDVGARFMYLRAEDMKRLEMAAHFFHPHHASLEEVHITPLEDVHLLEKEDGPITEWIRDFLQKHRTKKSYNLSNLHAFRPSIQWNRHVEERHACGQSSARTMCTDGGQILVANQATLDWMNVFAFGSTDDPSVVPMQTFRSNMVLQGAGVTAGTMHADACGLPPNVEDIIAIIEFEDGYLYFGDLSVRCSVTMVEPSTGKLRSDKEPLGCLQWVRPSRPPEKKGVTFGVNCVAVPKEGDSFLIKKGDSYTITACKY